METMKLFLSVFIAVLTGCGGAESSEGNSKPLFSYWEDESGAASPLDLRGASFDGYREISFFYEDGAQCDCRLRLTGSESSGTYVVNTCYYFYASSANGDPGCDALNHVGTYSKSESRLTICDNEQECTNYY